MTTLYLVRHGETEENASQILQGHLPGHLSERGREQLRALHDELLSIPFDAVLCSDLQRCVDSAAILLEGRDIPLTYTPLLRERDWGSLTGASIPVLKTSPFPADVETVEAMLQRAQRFLRLMHEQHDGQTVLIVSHGLFCRALRAAYSGRPMAEIDRMQNATFRVIQV